jgi:hypothetical protein
MVASWGKAKHSYKTGSIMPRWRLIFMACIGVIIAASAISILQGSTTAWWLFIGMMALLFGQIWEVRKATRANTSRQNGKESR